MARRDAPRFLTIAAVAAAGLLLQAAPVTARAADEALRICADPDNLPFSAEQGEVRGLYVELAELLGAKLGLPVRYTWWYTHYQRRAMRNSILANDCDAMIALPADAEYRHRGVQKSRPFLAVGYALVSPPGFQATTLEALKGKRIGVQFGSTPQLLLATLGGFEAVTFRTVEEVFAALGKGDVDVAMLWGPVAGYENKARQQGRWQVVPLAGHDLSGQVVVGVRADHAALKARIDEALTDLQPQIQGLAAKYGFPLGKPVDLAAPRLGSGLRGPTWAAAPATGVAASLWVQVADAPARPASGATTAPARRAAAPARPASQPVAAAAAPPPAEAVDPLVTAGKTRFNDQCSHCHGANGASPVRERDVRRLSIRYDADKWRDVALKTIREGRPDLGMPTWKETLNDDQIKELIAFLGTIQK